MDLPTYTSIWRIEKRLYKLYDFRLPMPVPVGQIAVFAAITVPYVILLTILGLPFNHSLFWLYVLPPGVITWLATRPVLESKRLPELVISQVRYLGEPGIWCRMAPLAEKDDVVVIGKVWRRDEELSRSPAEAPALAPAAAPAVARRAARVRPAAARKAAAAQATPSRSAARASASAPSPSPRPRRAAEQRGRATQWPGSAPGPAGVPPVVAAPAAAVDTSPAEIAHDERQAPLRPAAGPVGRPTSRPGFPVSTPGLPPADQAGVPRQARPEGAAAAARPPAAWPVKDPHAPASPSAAAQARPAWTAPVPPAPVPPARADRGRPAGPVVPAAADPVRAGGDPVPVPADPVPGASDHLVARAEALATPDTAMPVPPATPAVSVPAQGAPAEPAAGPRAGPAGFFIGVVRPEVPEDRTIPHEPADDQAVAPGPVADQTVTPGPDEAKALESEAVEPQTAGPEVAVPGTVHDATAERGAVEPGAAEPGAAEPGAAESGAPEPGAAEPGAAESGAPEGEMPGSGLAEPRVAESEVDEPAATVPDPAALVEAGDESAEPGLAEPELAAVQPELAEPRGDEPGRAAPESVQPEIVEPEAADPEAVGDETPKSELAEPQKPGPQKPEAEAPGDEAPEPGAAFPAARAQAPAPEVLPEIAALLHPGFPPGADAADETGAPDETEPPAAPGAPDVAHEGLRREDRSDEDAYDDAPDDDAPDQDPPGETADPAVVAPSSPTPPTPPIVVVRGGPSARPTMVERALSGPGQHRSGGNWRGHVRVVPGGHGPGRPDMERRDRARVLLPINGPRLIVVLGCTVGAGQTVTTWMLGDVLASLRGEPVAALDLNPGQTSLSDMARTSPAGSARGLLAGATPAVPGQRGGGRLDLIAHDSAPDGGLALADQEYARVLEILTSRYPLTLTDPGASAVARVLSAADQLVLVAPASADAARAVAMTMEWLDGHGYGELCTGAITVINGVSKRSMSHVEQAELVVRGRCRAIVRVPWDDHLGAPPAEQGISDAVTADAESRFAQLRPPVQLAYTALAGVLVSALAVEGSRAAPPGGPVPPGGAPQRWAAR